MRDAAEQEIGARVHFPLTRELSERPLPENDRAADLAALPQAGSWKCGSPEQTARARDTMFTSVPVVNLKDGESREQSLPYAVQAQLSGWPLLVRTSGRDTAHLGQRLSHLVSNLDQTLESSDIGTYEPTCKSWAGVRGLSGPEVQALTEAVGGDLTPGALFKAMMSDKTVTVGGRKLPLGAKMTLQNYGLEVDESDKQYLKSLREGGFLESLTSPVWPEDIEDYSTLFLHGRGHRTGAHIDDSSGGTYFYLRVVTGKKRVRIWPILDPEGLRAWQQAEDDRHAADMEFPFRGFVFNSTLSGGLPSRWTERGFEWGLSPPGGFKMDPEPVTGAMRDAYRCYVEVEVNAGEELFVGSAVPHQVETLEPALAVSKNYRFTNFAWMTRARFHALAEAVGMPHMFPIEDHDGDEVMSFDDPAEDLWDVDADPDGVTVGRFRDLWLRGARPRTRPGPDPPAILEALLRDVMLAWADPSIAVDAALINGLTKDSPRPPRRSFEAEGPRRARRWLLAAFFLAAAAALLLAWKDRGARDMPSQKYP